MSKQSNILASGIWLYDGIVPMRIAVYRTPARYAATRYDDDDQLDESRPNPETKDGFLYFCSPGKSGEYLTIDEAKAWTDAQPWGPVKWD